MSSKDWLEKDFYAVLGVAKDAPAAEVKKAYRRLARELHPDHNPGNAAAEERFKAVSEAYDVLSDDNRRREYDEMRSLFESGAFRRSARGGAGGQHQFDVSDLFGQGGGRDQRFGGASFSDLFGSIFSGGAGTAPRGPGRGRDVEAEIFLDFADAVQGTTQPLTLRTLGVCETCHGDGAKPGTRPRTCTHCNGTGVVNRNQGAFGFSEACRDCQGVGTVVDQKCPECHGTGGVTKTRTLTVRIPAGVADGQRIRLAGRGEPGERGGPPGDLYVRAIVRPDNMFGRSGDDLTVTIPVTYAESALGAEVRVPTLDGMVKVKVPPGTPSGRLLRVRGRGVPKRDGGTGDLLVTVEIVVPQQLSEEAREALLRFAELAPPLRRDHLERR
ncbi:molecular chaperone DnaJ [Catellatospora sp. KI3]|uniref:molecular chaperone DnaJ n=1 Tax=Catellatospora sp. KI3 TaxID=3041620 RepID=UPI002482ADD3|nr:molecular chaperone DnaJ [Catellatospora sp. KI3]MDI1461752.1 molecular chaperone DnaJ [Catellatospora sp. KI3]